jgi:hypothetical protein
MRPQGGTVCSTRRWPSAAGLLSPTPGRARRPWARTGSAVRAPSRQPCRGASAGNVAGALPVPVTTTSAPMAASPTAVA